MAINITDAEWNKLQEAVAILAGWRPLKGDKPAKAVTKQELAQLQSTVTRLQQLMSGKLPDMTSTTVSAAPTADEHNALRADVAALHDALAGLFSGSAK